MVASQETPLSQTKDTPVMRVFLMARFSTNPQLKQANSSFTLYATIALVSRTLRRVPQEAATNGQQQPLAQTKQGSRKLVAWENNPQTEGRPMTLSTKMSQMMQELMNLIIISTTKATPGQVCCTCHDHVPAVIIRRGTSGQEIQNVKREERVMK